MQLEFETIIECSVKELFDFHANTENLTQISPKNIKVEILNMDKPIDEGSKATLKIKKGFIGFRWELIFDKVSPNLIIDRAIHSPFKSFVHEHHFITIDQHNTMLKDIITFELPLAPLSNPIMWFIKHDMQQMFIHRHKATLEHFRNKL